MEVPKKVICEFKGANDSYICEVDQGGWGRCGDAIVDDDGELCLWIKEVLEWQEIEPEYLKGE